jgi:hypothetical protein
MGWFEDAFPRQTCKWTNDFTDFYDHDDGAIVIINGSVQVLENMRRLSDLLIKFKWVLLVSIGDEGSGQHLEWIQHPRISIWVYDPKPGKHDGFHPLPAGPLRECERRTPPRIEEKPMDWFFSGSVRDRRWNNEIHALPKERGQVYPHHLGSEEYALYLSVSKVVPCRPSWSSPETCRLYDALEAGCVPIVGIYPSQNPPGHEWWRTYGFDWPHYWEYLFGETPPFPVIQEPTQLADAVRTALSEWPHNAQRISTWWNLYKARLKESLQAEVRRLQQ